MRAALILALTLGCQKPAVPQPTPPAPQPSLAAVKVEAQPQPTPEVKVVDLTEMTGEYEKNPAAAKLKYQDRLVGFRAGVLQIAEEDGFTYLGLFPGVAARLKPSELKKVAAIHNGDYVTLICTAATVQRRGVLLMPLCIITKIG